MAQGTKRTILIIGENAQLKGTAASHLKKRGHNVRVAPRGLQGVTWFRSMHPDLVIIDARRPSEAFGMLRLIRHVATHPRLGERARWRYGVHVLCRSGNEQDLLLLAKYLNHSQRRYQMKAVDGIVRILKLKLSVSWEHGRFEKGNSEYMRQIQEALSSRGIPFSATSKDPTTPKSSRRPVQ